MKKYAILLLLPLALHAGEAPAARPVLQAARLAAPPTLDGRVDADEWAGAAVLGAFTQLEPQEGAPGSERTEVRLGYDTENLYVAARCWDSDPSAVVANNLTRDNEIMTYEDTVEIILDTFHDRQNGFLFAVNPLGAQLDAIVRHEGEEVNLDWDGIWQSAAARDAEGWSAEIAIPFKTLRFPDVDEQTWGLNVGRFIARKREQSFWTPLSRSYGFWARYKISQFGEVTGLQGLEQAGRYHLKPYVLGGTRRDRGDLVLPEDEDGIEAGMDLKVQITSTLVGDLTVNTDFAEAEADAQQVNLTRFKLFFPEKRAFFLEGADLFYFGERPEPYKDPEFAFFFSRRIGLSEEADQNIPLLAGAKLTGRVAGTGLGFLSATTDDARLLDVTGDLRTEPRTNYSVLRLKRDVLSKSTVGLMALNKEVSGEGGGRHGGAGVDWDFAFGESLKIGGFVAGTETPGLEGDDWAAYSDVFYDSKLWRVRAAYAEIGEDFNPEMGFLTRAGVQRVRSAVTRNFWPEGPRVRQWFLVHYMDYVTDRDGRIETRLHWLETSVFFQGSSGIALKLYDQLEGLRVPFEIHPGVVVPAGSYRFNSLFFGFQTDYSKPVGGAGRLLAGELYDGDVLQLFGAVTVRPIEGLITETIYERTEVDLPAGRFTRHLASFYGTYSFSQALSVLTLIQWNRDEDARGKLVLNWLWRPGSNLYLIYDDTRDLTDSLTPVRGRLLPASRRFVAKVSYLFDF